jgi:hypothetical protein
LLYLRHEEIFQAKISNGQFVDAYRFLERAVKSVNPSPQNLDLQPNPRSQSYAETLGLSSLENLKYKQKLGLDTQKQHFFKRYPAFDLTFHVLLCSLGIPKFVYI